jgi:type VII secretion-associated protein (TIGR03931 family)
MSGHRAVIETGPGVVRRLCCGTKTVADDDAVAALAAIDDQLALVDGRPVAVASFWRSMLRSVRCADSDGVIVVHPSWWPASRIGVVAAAADSSVVLQPRSWLLAGATPDEAVIVEIAERLVAIGGSEVAAVPRRMPPHPVAEDVAAVVAAMSPAVVLIDGPDTVAGAPALAASIAEAVRGTAREVVLVDDARLPRLARLAAATLSTEASEKSEPSEPRPTRVPTRGRALAGVGAAGAVVAVLCLSVPAPVNRHDVPPAAGAPSTFLVEGRVAVTVPANWATQRVLAGPGSARVQVTSPSDPEVALHVTQTPVAGETLSRAAERLKQAIDAEPSGVFVDFDPSGSSAGRPAVTYREVRAAHHVRWAVLVDGLPNGMVRISVGCQSRPGGEDAVRAACDQAVRSAHAVG